MAQTDNWPTPVHCPPSHDCRTWAKPGLDFDDKTTDHGQLHEHQHEMEAQFAHWLDTSIAAARGLPSIGRHTLPNPNNVADEVDLSLIDPTTITLIGGYGQIRQRQAQGAYVGLVAQEPFGLWRGLTGFYITWCVACDKDGNRAMRHVRNSLHERGLTWRSIWDLHAGLWPRHGWFPNDRLVYGCQLTELADVSPLWIRGGDVQRDTPEAALVATGPVVTTLANLVLVDSYDRDAPKLRELVGNGEWFVRIGSRDALRRLAGLTRPSTVRASSTSNTDEVPATWGAYRLAGERTTHGPVPNLWFELRQPLRRIVGKRARTAEYVALEPDRAVRLQDITRLTPALDKPS